LKLGTAKTYSNFTNHSTAFSGVMSEAINIYKCNCVIVIVKNCLECVQNHKDDVCIRFHMVMETKDQSLQTADIEF